MDGQLRILEKSGRAGLNARLVSKNNLMRVKGDLQLSRFLTSVKKETSRESKKSESVDKIIFGALSSLNVDIGAKFSFETKMDDFRLSKVAFSGNVMQ